jgi:hypothetical protein
MPKMQIRDGYEGHKHRGEEVFPGDVIEVTAQQAAFLTKIGAADPVKKTARKADSAQEPEEENQPEGEETSPLS